jgi:NTE family protein
MLLKLLHILIAGFIFLPSLKGQEIKIPLKEKKLLFGLIEKTPALIPKIGLALSGGGARGFAHLAFLEAVEKSGIPVEFIVGTSMGSIIGGLYSAGYDLTTLKTILLSTDWEKFISTNELKRSQLFVDQKLAEDRAIITFQLDGFNPEIPTSISSGRSISSFLNSLVINAPIHTENSFDDLLFRFRAVSANLVSGKEVVIDRGSLTRAMRASSSVSFLLPPVAYDSLLLVDGGLVANIPALITRRLGSDAVLGSNTTSQLRTRDKLKYPWDVADQLVSIPMEKITTQNLQVVDLLIEPELKEYGNNDFGSVNEIYQAGRDAAYSKIDAIKKLYKNLFVHKLQKDKIVLNVSFPENPNKFERKIKQDLDSLKEINRGDIYFELVEFFRAGGLSDISAVVDSTENGDVIRINYIENPVVEKIRLGGKFLAADSSHMLSFFSGLIDFPFNVRKTLEASLNLIRDFRQVGFSSAEIKNISFDNGVLTVELDEHLLDKIIVSGNSETNINVITREFDLKAGDRVKIDVVKKGLLDLQATNLFSDVEAELVEQNGSLVLKIKVIEKSTNLLRLGLKVDNENFTQLFADLREENLFGSGTELGFMFNGGTRNRSFIVEQKANRLFDTYFTYKVQLYHKFKDINLYADDSVASSNKFSRSKSGEYRQIYSGVSLGIGTQAEKFGNLIVEARYELNEIKNKLDYFGDTYAEYLAAVKFSLFIDSQNKMPYPTSGYLINSYYETAQKNVGGNFGYTKFLFDYKSYYTFSETNTLSPHLIIGFADETLPLSQQFSLGGQYSFYGYRNDEYRGRQITLTSLEYRTKLPFKIFFDTYLKFRYDLGSIWDQQSAIRFKDFRHGIGATISFDTPLGQADFSVGRSFYFVNSFNKNSIKRGPVYFYFTIGY